MRRSLPKRDPLLLRIGAAKKEAGRAFGFVTMRVPKADGEVSRQASYLLSIKRSCAKRNSATGIICCDRNLTAVAFLAYGLLVTLKNRLQELAPGLTPKAVLEPLAPMQMLDVTFPTTDGCRLNMPPYTQPTPEQKLLLHQLRLTLPAQPPPTIQLKPELFSPGMLHL